MVDLPAPDEAGEPQHPGRLALDPRMGLAADIERLPLDVARAAKREVDHPRRRRGVGQFVDQDEAAERAVVRKRLEHDRAVGIDLGDADLVELERARREMLEAVDVDPVLGRLDGGRDGLGGELEPVAAPGQQRVLVHPHDGRFELVGDGGRVGGMGDNIAAPAIDRIGEGQDDRLAASRARDLL